MAYALYFSPRFPLEKRASSLRQFSHRSHFSHLWSLTAVLLPISSREKPLPSITFCIGRIQHLWSLTARTSPRFPLEKSLFPSKCISCIGRISAFMIPSRTSSDFSRELFSPSHSSRSNIQHLWSARPKWRLDIQTSWKSQRSIAASISILIGLTWSGRRVEQARE
ncbi:hypothetical protein AVEN_209521-1 [Araneus ventricosus]|uniref:Uncharacterized protein n=1 Tax=Araneus ventricosus TaxID=182803 RepID=A0A4Y2IMY4_ARAVE|nr:hypothetical protein AVEN_209521-1 [Araneus ventricosus]